VMIGKLYLTSMHQLKNKYKYEDEGELG